jgi:hypothetical protein
MWPTEFNGEDLLGVLKQRREWELEGMDPADPVTANSWNVTKLWTSWQTMIQLITIGCS